MSFIKTLIIYFLMFAQFINFIGAQNSKPKDMEPPYRIISLDNSATEILCQFDLINCIIGRNATSLYPLEIQKIASLGNHENISVEGILALQPTHIILNDQVKPEKLEQVNQVKNITIIKMPKEISENSYYQKCQMLAQVFKKSEKGEKLISDLKNEIKLLNSKSRGNTNLNTMCLYIRGKGTLLMLGEASCAVNIIKLAGGKMCYPDIIEPKPLTAEALIEANPDVIITFESGLNSIGGVNEFLKLQGIDLTNAGKEKRIISIDGQLLSTFGPRTGKTLLELNEALFNKTGYIEIKASLK